MPFPEKGGRICGYHVFKEPTMKTLTARLILAIVILASARAGVHTAPDWSPAVVMVPTPAAPGSAQPQLSSIGDRVVLSWIERAGENATLRFADRTDSGWSEPRSVASGADWFVNWADVPSVIPLQHESMAAHWLEKSASSTYAYDLRIAFSRDRGRTWSSAITPHHDGTRTEHGFASLFPMPGQGLGVVWLDGRQKDGAPEGTNGGNMSLRGALFAPDGSQASETVIDD